MKALQTLKSDFNKTRLVSINEPSISDNQIKLKIERFSFTANNITYAVAGDFLKYWHFFPASNEDGSDASSTWGHIPVWGFAVVTESNSSDIAVGERFFGYYPPTEYCVMQPSATNPATFIDGSAHRSHLPGGYNLYRKVSDQVDVLADNEQSLLYPLFATAFSIVDLCAEYDWYGADHAIILSASSKTSIGLAYAINYTKGAPKPIGVTSSRHKNAVESLGIYDQVFSYDEIDQLENETKCCIVDMSGNKNLLGSLHKIYGENMMSTLSVGATHWDSLEVNDGIIQERTHQFFAPSQIESMIKRFGPQGFSQQLGAFIQESFVKTRSWLKFEELDSIESLSSIYPDVCAGKIDANTGVMVVL